MNLEKKMNARNKKDGVFKQLVPHYIIYPAMYFT